MSSAGCPTHQPTARLPLARLLVIVSLGFALTMLVNTIEPAVLGHRVLELAPGQANTATGLITSAGLIVATLTQPVVGLLSDRTRSRAGRRLPFFVAGTLIVLVALYLLAVSPWLEVVAASVLLAQLGSSTVQGPWQALIPDLVPSHQRGQAAGLKAMMDIVGLVVGRQAAGELIARAPEWGVGASLAAVAVPAVAIVLALALTAACLRDRSAASAAPGLSLRDTLRRSFVVDWRRYPAFGWWFLHRMLFWGALILLNTFLLYYLIDVVRMQQAEAQRFLGRISAVLGAVLAVASIPSGWFVDRYSRRPLVIASSIMAGCGGILLLLTRDQAALTAAAAIIGAGIGAFMTASWALVTDIVPPDQAAHYLGIGNMAVAGSSAVARLLGGLLIDPLNRWNADASAGYLVVFGLATAAFWLSILPALRLPRKAGHSPPR